MGQFEIKRRMNKRKPEIRSRLKCDLSCGIRGIYTIYIENTDKINDCKVCRITTTKNKEKTKPNKHI